MAITVTEQVESRETSGGDSPTFEYLFIVEGTDDEAAALAKLTTETTSTKIVDSRLLHRQSYDVTPIGDPLRSLKWYGTVTYGKDNRNPDTAASAKFSFSIGGQQKQITTTEIGQVGKGIGGGAAPDAKDMIGLTSDGKVQGVSVLDPTYTFNLTQYFNDSSVTEAYRLICLDTVGKVNVAAFRGHAAKEVRCDGIDGNLIEEDIWELSFKFSVRKKRTNVPVGDINLATVEGWEYVWVYYRPSKMLFNGKKFATQIPQFAYVTELYKTADFTQLGLT